MTSGNDVLEYIESMGALLRQQPELYGIMVERQVQSRLLPKIAGPRVTLEPTLWQLLIFCLEGHEAVVPALDDVLFEKARAAATNRATLAGDQTAAFPDAALAVIRIMETLREAGSYPPPRR